MIEIIPAIDMIEGKCVRLTKGDYAQKKVYNDSPLEVAKMFESMGIRRLHLVDLDGAKSKHVVNDKVLRDICRETRLVVDFGGGIKSGQPPTERRSIAGLSATEPTDWCWVQMCVRAKSASTDGRKIRT